MTDMYEGRPACVHGAYIDTENCWICCLGPKWWDQTSGIIKEQDCRKREQAAKDEMLRGSHFREMYEAATAELAEARKTIDGLLAKVSELKESHP